MSRKAYKIVTRESMATMLAKNDPAFVQKVIGRALVAIFNRQTADEKQVNDVREHNTVGFSGADAHGGSITAKFWLKHRRLEPWMVKKWTENSRGFPRICKYHRQLNEIAMAKKVQHV